MYETDSHLPPILLAFRLWGVSDRGIVQLLALRKKYRSQRPRWDGSAARLGFARWLYLSGRISG